MTQANQAAIVYFSMSGHTEKLAHKLAGVLNGKLFALRAPRYRPGVIGYIRAGFDSLRQKCDLAPQEFQSLADYDRLVLCGPVWTSYPATPIRALLRSNVAMPQSVSLFLTSGGHSPAKNAFDTAETDLGRALAATGVLGNKDEETEREADAIREFVSELNQLSDSKVKSVK